MSAHGVTTATRALRAFVGADASRQLAAAALAIWRQPNGWLLDDGDDAQVLAAFDPADWPRTIHHHDDDLAQRAAEGGPHV